MLVLLVADQQKLLPQLILLYQSHKTMTCREIRISSRERVREREREREEGEGEMRESELLIE